MELSYNKSHRGASHILASDSFLGLSTSLSVDLRCGLSAGWSFQPTAENYELKRTLSMQGSQLRELLCELLLTGRFQEKQHAMLQPNKTKR